MDVCAVPDEKLRHLHRVRVTSQRGGEVQGEQASVAHPIDKPTDQRRLVETGIRGPNGSCGRDDSIKDHPNAVNEVTAPPHDVRAVLQGEVLPQPGDTLVQEGASRSVRDGRICACSGMCEVDGRVLQ